VAPSAPVAAVSSEGRPAHHRTFPERVLTFAWRPRGASPDAYFMSDPLDQHRIVLTRGVEPNHTYPVVIAFHGQPRRGEAPRTYRFLQTVSEVTRELVDEGAIAPVVLVTPVFRYQGQNWPKFELAEFLDRIREILLREQVRFQDVYVVGHSGAAGCGGAGLNRVDSIAPKAVGFFDTCVGAGFVRVVKALTRQGVPTMIVHSVETAGFHPRPRQEYDADFDFGRVYSSIGLAPSACPAQLPEVPLRPLEYRCASNDAGTTRALVLDTGRGQKAHDALVPVALRYFLRSYLEIR